MFHADRIDALTFDLFGTVLDLGGSLTPAIGRFLADANAGVTAGQFWNQWRARQRIEQYQDNIVMMGHSGYLTVAQRALVYVLKLHGLSNGELEVDGLMQAWRELVPFRDVQPALESLRSRFRLVVLSNGEQEFLDDLASRRIGWEFDEVISVETVGAFKPHPAVYRVAAQRLQLEPGRCLMVSANSFDVMGARMCGYRGVYVNRYGMPFEETQFLPDATVDDFTQLAEFLSAE